MDVSISLTDELARFVEAKVETGRYASSTEVVRAALHLLQQHDRNDAERRLWLGKAWQDGIDSGDFQEVDFERFRADARSKLKAGRA